MSHSTKILLLNPPYSQTIIRDNFCCFTSKSNYLWPPVDLLYLSANLSHPEIKLSVIDAVAQKLSIIQTRSLIKKFKPDIIISLTGTASYQTDLFFLQKIIHKSKTKLFLLGNMPVFEPEFFLKKYTFVTGIIHNFFGSDIANFFLDKISPPPYISYKTGKKIIIGSTNYFSSHNIPRLLSSPQYQLFPLKKYSSPLSRKKPFVTVLASFGCPYNCQFCIGSCLKYTPRHLDCLKAEFNTISQNKIKEIFFEDSTFNTDLKFTESVCRLLIDNKYKFSWSANIHNRNATPEILSLMKKAGCHTVNIGVESANLNTLNQYAPTKNPDSVKKAFALCRQLHIRTLGFFIIGFPNENKTTSQNTINLAVELDPDLASFSILTPDYGTKLYSESLQKKLIKKTKSSFDSSGAAILNNPNFSLSEQNQTLKQAYIRFYLRPKKILKFIISSKNYLVYFKNGLSLIQNQIFKK